MNLKVSIIIPVYNVEKYLDKCLQSLLSQTFSNIELIVVNDGTKDQSQLIIDKYKAAYPQKIHSYIKANGGLSDARNYGLQYATGDYISFIDSDDYVEPDLIAELLKASNEGQKKIVACGYYKDWDQKREIIIDNKHNTIQSYLKEGLVVAWNKIYKREWLIKTGIIFPKGLLYEDIEFFCKLLTEVKNINEISWVQKPLIHYIQRGDSISYSETNRIHEIQVIIKNVYDFYKNHKVSNDYFEALEYKFVKALFGSYFIKYLSIKDRKLRQVELQNNWLFIKTTFPEYKNNKFIHKCNSLTCLYLMSMNKFTYSCIQKLPLSIIKKIF